MLSRLPFPLIYVLEALVVVPLLGGFVAVTSFLAADPVASLNLHGKHLPSTWEAAVPNHGNFLRGYLISNHPVAFAAAVALLIVSAVALYPIHREQVAQRTAAQGAQLRLHKIANACVFAVWGLYGYILIWHLLVGVPAA
jgi:hypothetical protein